MVPVTRGRALPSIALGIAVPTFVLYPGWGSVLVVMGESLGPWAGVLLLRRLNPPPTDQSRLRWQIAFYVCGMALSCPIAALFGSLGAVAGHRFSLTALPGVFLAYTMVEAIGLVLFAPPIIEWFTNVVAAPRNAGHGHPRRPPWIYLLPLGIESARWLLHAATGGLYADLLIYVYFPLVAWCALTESSQRTNGLLLWIAVATLSSEAFRLHGDGVPIANFDLFRIALVTLILTTMGQVWAALASERRAAFADVARVLAHNIVSTELDRAVIRSTFDWFATRPRELLAVERIAINLTGASLSSATLFEWIEHCRVDAKLSAQHFAFEITESQAILNMDSARTLIKRLRDSGYGVALDDFGTGVATFDYLKRFPVDYLKIDGSFIRNLAGTPIDREIVNGIVRLARVMQIGTVAEYVADETIAVSAVNAGVDSLQGYGIQPPVPLADALSWCRSSDAARWSEWTDPLVRQIVG